MTILHTPSGMKNTSNSCTHPLWIFFFYESIIIKQILCKFIYFGITLKGLNSSANLKNIFNNPLQSKL